MRLACWSSARAETIFLWTSSPSNEGIGRKFAIARTRSPDTRDACATQGAELCLECAMILESLLRQRRRRRLRARPFPEKWLTLIQRHVVTFRRLSASDRAELLSHIQVFLAEKRFEGCGGFAITDEVRVTITAQACLLLLHRKTDYFPGLLTILVYPLTYMVEEKRQIAEHVWEEGTVGRLGETGRRMGSLVLSWGAVNMAQLIPPMVRTLSFTNLLTSSTSKMTQSTGCRNWRRANSN